MINDYLWTTLYAQREAELRARAARRGGDAASSGAAQPGPIRRLLVRWGLRRPDGAPVTAPATTTAKATPGLVLTTSGVGTDVRPAAPAAPAAGEHQEKAA